MSISNSYNLLTAILSLFLAVLYAIVLVKVRAGSKFTFVIIIATMMMLSNMFGIVVTCSNNYITSHSPTTDPPPEYGPAIWIWIWVQGLSAIIRDGCYNAAHWEFAYKYFVISHEVPLLLKG